MKVLVFVRVEANNAVKIDYKLVYITQNREKRIQTLVWVKKMKIHKRENYEKFFVKK